MQSQSLFNVELENKYKDEMSIIETGMKYFVSLCNRVIDHDDMESALYRAGLDVDAGKIEASILSDLKLEVERNLSLYRFEELHEIFGGKFRLTRRNYQMIRENMITIINSNDTWGRDRTFNIYTGRVYINRASAGNANISYLDSLTEENYTAIKLGNKYFNEAQFIKLNLFPEHKILSDEYSSDVQESPTSILDTWNFDAFVEIDEIFLLFMRTALKNGISAHDLSVLICNTLVDRVIKLCTDISDRLSALLKPNVRYIGLEILNNRKSRHTEIDIFDKGEITPESLKSQWTLLSYMKDMMIVHLINKSINGIAGDMSILEAHKVLSNLNVILMTTSDYNLDVVGSFIPGFIMSMNDNSNGGLIPRVLAELSGALSSTHRTRITSGRTIIRSIKESLFDFNFTMREHVASMDKFVSDITSESMGYGTKSNRDKRELGYSLMRVEVTKPDDVAIGSLTVVDKDDSADYVQLSVGGESGAPTPMTIKESYYLDTWESEINMLTSDAVECFDLTTKSSVLRKLNGLKSDIIKVMNRKEFSSFFREIASDILQRTMTASSELANRNISRERNTRLYGAIDLGSAWK